MDWRSEVIVRKRAKTLVFAMFSALRARKQCFCKGGNNKHLKNQCFCKGGKTNTGKTNVFARVETKTIRTNNVSGSTLVFRGRAEDLQLIVWKSWFLVFIGFSMF